MEVEVEEKSRKIIINTESRKANSLNVHVKNRLGWKICSKNMFECFLASTLVKVNDVQFFCWGRAQRAIFIKIMQKCTLKYL